MQAPLRQCAGHQRNTVARIRCKLCEHVANHHVCYRWVAERAHYSPSGRVHFGGAGSANADACTANNSAESALGTRCSPPDVGRDELARRDTFPKLLSRRSTCRCLRARLSDALIPVLSQSGSGSVSDTSTANAKPNLALLATEALPFRAPVASPSSVPSREPSEDRGAYRAAHDAAHDDAAADGSLMPFALRIASQPAKHENRVRPQA